MKSYLETKNKADCFGCRACEQVCPKKCISINKDEEGFLYPNIDKEKCISCNKCIKVCPNTKNDEIKSFNPEVYAVQIKDEKILMESSSGGMFSVLANYVLSNKGVVFGTTMTDTNVKYISVDKKKDLKLLRGAKYVQSDTMSTYSEVKDLAKKDKLVLYVGTPCQIMGLNKFLGKKYNNVITVDIICHGVPSQKFLKKYKEYICKKYNTKNIYIDFRDKTINGWSHTMKCTFYNNRGKKKQKYYNSQLSSYYYAFMQGFNYRESCYNCTFATTKRNSDITIGDFWSLDKSKKDKFNWKNGVSLVIINSKLGKKIFNYVKNEIYYEKSTIEEAKKGNMQLSRPVERKKIRDEIYKHLDNMEYTKLQKKYLRSNKYYKYKIRSLISMNLKKIKKKKM